MIPTNHGPKSKTHSSSNCTRLSATTGLASLSSSKAETLPTSNSTSTRLSNGLHLSTKTTSTTASAFSTSSSRTCQTCMCQVRWTLLQTNSKLSSRLLQRCWISTSAHHHTNLWSRTNLSNMLTTKSLQICTNRSSSRPNASHAKLKTLQTASYWKTPKNSKSQSKTFDGNNSQTTTTTQTSLRRRSSQTCR